MADEMPRGYLAKYGERLLDGGYRILPIPKGDKSPPKDKDFGDWRKVNATLKLHRAWIAGSYSRAGVGIDTRLTPGADIDVMDAEAAQYMEDWITERFGLAPVRVGQAPKRLLAFRCEEEFPKITSKYWVDEFCAELGKDGLTKPYRVEILAAGQQYVAFHTHPDTGQPYKWVRNGSILTINREDLPVLTQDDAQAICDHFDEYAESQGWTIKKGTAEIRRLAASKGQNIDREDVFATDKQKTDISDDDLRRKLMMVPGAETYETWVQIGMSLFHQYDGEQLGLDLWHEWSATATNYDSEALDDKWDTFDAEGKSQTPLTARIIIKLADEQAAVIAIETFRELREKIAGADGTVSLQAACDDIKKIEFGIMQREQLAGNVAKRYKAITDTTMSISTARALTRYEAPKPKDAPKWLENYVYIQKDNTFYNAKTRHSLSYEAFNASMNRWMLTKTEVLEGKSMPEAQAATFALNSAQIDVLSNRMYFPGEDQFFGYNGLRYVNSYNDGNVPDVPEKITKREQAAIDRVEAHTQNLFPGDRVLLDALAWIVQNPGKRLNWAILIQGTEGDGKSFFSGLLSAVLGGDNVRNMAPTALEEKYTSWAEGCQVAFFEEVKLHGHNRFDVLNKVKPLITNVMISVRRMNVDTYEVVNMASYIFTTNFRNALPLDDNDTRYYILFSAFQTKNALEEFKADNPDYYGKLYEALEHPGALRKWLLAHKVPDSFKPQGRAPHSKDKAEMISYVEKEETASLREVLNGRSGIDEVLLDTSSLGEAMSAHDIDVPYGRAMAILLVDNGFSKLGQVKIEKDVLTFWSRKPQLFRNKAGTTDTAKIREYRRFGGL